MRISCVVIVLCVALGSIIQGSLEKNNTLKLKNENFPSNLNFTGFKERHRRLVPYMTYYLVGNNVENQSPRSTKYEKNRERNIPRKSQIRQNLNSRERNFFARQKFSPSVQYDPKELGPNNAYFTPIRYGMKLNQKDYSSFTYQNARPVYSRPTVENIVPENKILLTTETPKKLQNPPERNYLPLNVIKTIPSTVDDYYLDYETHGKQYDYEQPFESFRYTDKIQIFKPPISRPNDFKVPVSELDHIVKTLQLSNQLPEMLNKDNIDSSIRTLVEILNILHNARRSQQSQIPNPVKLKSKPPDYGFNEDLTRPQVLETNYYVTPNVIDRPQEIFPDKITEPLHPLMNFKSKPKNQKIIQYYVPKDLEINNQYKEIYSQSNENDTENQSFNLHSVNTLENDRFKYPISTEKPTNNYPVPNVPKDTQNIPPSLKYGATRGKPHVDYPAYSTIPPTNFNCKQQRYKGFFGDPATRCQVWHYCDLNGGKSSFLCPNGTIFNQVALTCDWWFNVKCESTTQLYVLNERLYKYILPIMPKFPEDFTGPEVDRYLEEKFKEIEAKLLEKKLKKQQEEKDKTEEKIKSEMLTENNTE